MEGGLLLDVVVSKGAAVLKLLASEDEPLLIWRNAFLVLDLSLDIVNGVRGLNLEGDGLAGEGLNNDLHLQTSRKIKKVSQHKNRTMEYTENCYTETGQIWTEKNIPRILAAQHHTL
jgi:hypothetical protein